MLKTVFTQPLPPYQWLSVLTKLNILIHSPFHFPLMLTGRLSAVMSQEMFASSPRNFPINQSQNIQNLQNIQKIKNIQNIQDIRANDKTCQPKYRGFHQVNSVCSLPVSSKEKIPSEMEVAPHYTLSEKLFPIAKFDYFVSHYFQVNLVPHGNWPDDHMNVSM